MWNAFVELGMTDPDYVMEDSKGMTYRDFTFSFINELKEKTDEESLAEFLRLDVNDVVIKKLVKVGLLSDRVFEKENASPADILEQILKEKWVFEEGDVDMVVMQHQLDYKLDGKMMRMTASMVDKGVGNGKTGKSLLLIIRKPWPLKKWVDTLEERPFSSMYTMKKAVKLRSKLRT
jgi:hypothetical protein